MPSRREKRDKLIDVATKLGGCNALEERIRSGEGCDGEEIVDEIETIRRGNIAITPKDDIWDMYEWKTRGPYDYDADINVISDDLGSQGYRYTKNEGRSGGPTMFYFRRPQR